MLNPPFTTEQFLHVFKVYNEAVWPAPLVAYLLGLTAIVLAVRHTRYSDPVAAGVLALFWFFMGGVYHLGFFSRINPAAYLFGILFIVQGLLFLIYGVLEDRLTFRFRRDIYGLTGGLMMLYALAIYPALGALLGHSYPYAPLFGIAPCPATIFTFGLLLWTVGRVPGWLLIIPALWSLLGLAAAFTWGIREDVGLVITGVTATVMLLYRNRQAVVADDSLRVSSANYR